MGINESEIIAGILVEKEAKSTNQPINHL